MGVLLTSIVAIVLWVLLWGLDVKAFDAFMLSLLIVVLAGAAYVVKPFLPGNRQADAERPDPAPYT
jgi:Mn2+/Fe2+ NRAMP family transporter